MIASIPSLTDPRTSYRIHIAGDGSLVCDCQAFGSWKKRGLPCWHLRVFNASNGAIARCVAADHGYSSPNVLCRSCLYLLVAAMTGKIKRDYVPKDDVKAAKRAAAEKRKLATAKRNAKKKVNKGQVG